ncbi:MAG: NFACT family protein, partial [Clostridia bacterium]|nr:NFACT family protein [Clostridia bacterium]
MAIDGAMLHLVGNEIKEKLSGAKVDKIHQPSREELVFVMRGRNGNFRLLISARANCPRIGLTAQNIENPAQPPMRCMLLRKRLTSARLSDVRQVGLDRILMLDFEGFSELGDKQTLTLIIEIMGRCSNAILVDESNKVIDALKRVDGAMSSARMILPGMTYMPPPAQDKINIIEREPSDAARRIYSYPNEQLSKAILASIQGISPIISRELAWRAARSIDVRVGELTRDQRERLDWNIGKFANMLREGKGCPVMISERGGKPIDLSVMNVEQYGSEAVVKEFGSFSELLDAYCSGRDLADRMKVKSHDILRLLTNASDRVSRKLTVQRMELEAARERDKLRLYGDLINANIYRLSKGEAFCELENYYSEALVTVRIPLDPMLSP